jgi:hypothetical protein
LTAGPEITGTPDAMAMRWIASTPAAVGTHQICQVVE